MPCRCDNNACGACACAKSNTLCTPECHGKRNLDDVPCLNTEAGKKVKAMKIGEVRTALCASALSPIGDKGELLKRLADHIRKQSTSVKCGSESKGGESVGNGSSSSSVDPARGGLFKAILENEDDHHFLLSLSGKTVSASSDKNELRRAYLLLSTKVHPDKNGGSQDAIKAFQALLNAYERLANPEKHLEEDDEKPKKRQKTERFTRSNSNCFKTKIKCPQCREEWGGASLGLEDAAYNFLMTGLKQYHCHICSCLFGCMSALHYCPHCRKEFHYDPDDYHNKVKCENEKCRKEFGFWMFKVAERREREVRQEAKELHEQRLKKIAQKNRRAKRAGNRGGNDDLSNDLRLQEQLCLIKLRDTCPRCGWELEKGEKIEEASNHLAECNDKKKIKQYQDEVAEGKAARAKKESSKASEEEVLAFKQWEMNGRQVGQLWMLSDNMLAKQCNSLGLSDEGKRFEIIKRLSEYMRTHKVLMITDGKTNTTSEVKYDTCGIKHADEEDLPQNLNSMEREELQDLLASYNVKFNAKKDVKRDLIRKFEQARFKGREHIMIEDKPSNKDSADE